MSRYNSLCILWFLPVIILIGETNTNSVANLSMNESNMSSAQRARDVRGIWGGQHIHLEVGDDGATIEYDCAHGRINEKITPDRNGKFTVKGFYSQERGGPVRQGEDNAKPATYSGTIRDKTMTLTVTLVDEKETIGTYTLTQGKTGRIVKCL